MTSSAGSPAMTKSPRRRPSRIAGSTTRRGGRRPARKTIVARPGGSHLCYKRYEAPTTGGILTVGGLCHSAARSVHIKRPVIERARVDRSKEARNILGILPNQRSEPRCGAEGKRE